MQVATSDPEADAGQVYVVAVDENGATVGAADVVSVQNGEYPFVLEDLPTGNYAIFAGTDMDNDNFLCDAGEACGGFRTLDGVERVSVDPQTNPAVTGVDFVSEFRAVITSEAATADRVEKAAAEGIRLPAAENGSR